jgi:DNA ligase N terminus
MSKSHQRQTKLDSFLGITSKKGLKQSTLPFCFKPKLLSDNDEKIEDLLNSKKENHTDNILLVENINPSLRKRNQYALEGICDNDDEDEVIGKTSRRKTTMGKRLIINDDDDDEVIVKPTRKRITKGKRRVIDDDDDDEVNVYDNDDMDTTHLAMTPNRTEKSPTSDKCTERKRHDESSQGKNSNNHNDMERKKVDPEGHRNGPQNIDCHEEHPKPGVPQKSDFSDHGKIPSIPSTTVEFTTDSVQIQTEKFVDVSTKDASISIKDSSIKFPDQPLLYLVVCETLEKIEGISSRLEIQSILTNLFRHVRFSSSPKDLYDLVYLCSNSVAPSYDCLELGIGDAILIKAIGEAYGTKPCKSNI